MRIFFATWPEVTYQGVALTKMQAANRLISYWFLKDAPQDTLRRYLQEGFVTDRDMDELVATLSPESKRNTVTRGSGKQSRPKKGADAANATYGRTILHGGAMANDI